MEEKEESYIVVDRRKLSRCEWCGASESYYWPRRIGGTFCSSKCKGAASVGRCVFLYVIGLLLIIIAIVNSFEIFSSLEIGIFTVVLFSLLAIPYLYSGFKAKREVPRNSRQNEAGLG